MTEQLVLRQDEDGVAILTLNRPDKLNALNTELTQAIYDALGELDRDPKVRAVVLTGAGRGFCAGADLGEFATLTPANQALVSQRSQLTCHMLSMLQKLSKPIVSAADGPAVGGGAGLSTGCDMMVAGPNLKFGYPELRHQIVPAIVMTGLERAASRKAAFELFSLGRLIGAQEAVDMGFANRVAEDPLSEAIAIAHQWAKVSPVAMASAKSLFYRVGELPYNAAMEVGRDTNALMRGFPESAS